MLIIFFRSDNLDSFSVISAGIHFLNEWQRHDDLFITVPHHLEFRTWNIVSFIKFFLKDLLLNGFDNIGIRNHSYSLLFKFCQCIRIYVFYFNGYNIFIFSEVQNRVIVIEISLRKIRDIMTWRIRCRIQSIKLIIILQCTLYQHSSQLSTSQNSYFHFLFLLDLFLLDLINF